MLSRPNASFERLWGLNNPQPRVINVDKNPVYVPAVTELQSEGVLRQSCRLRQCKYLNNMVEQDHRTVKKRVWLAKGYGSFHNAWRTIRGVEAVHLIRKGRVRRVASHHSLAQARFLSHLFDVAI
jgi:transposase, IS6 family